jgi:hypothetical protein
MPAITLEDAFNTFDPLRPITVGQIPTLFVERDYAPTQELIAALTITRKNLKILFVGHRGSGKSSELTYLSTRLDKYISVPVPLYDIFKGTSVNHVEVIFAMTLRLLEKATDSQVLPVGMVKEAWDGLFNDAYLFLKRYLFGEEVGIPADKQTTFGLKVNMLVTEVEARIGTEAYTRAQVKEKFEGRVNEMLEKMNDVARLLEKDTGKRLLLVVEDLDKFDLQDTRNLFYEHARSLTAPYPSVVYTFPVAMRYSNDFPEIKKSFDETYILPNIALSHRDGSPNEAGRAKMRQIFTHRVSEELFEPEVVEKIILLSGGHVKTLIQLARQTVLKAIVDNQPVVQIHHLTAAAAALRDDYASLLTPDQIALLRKQKDDPRKDLVGVGKEQQELLANGSLLEFGNTRGPWGDVNPLALELLERQA